MKPKIRASTPFTPSNTPINPPPSIPETRLSLATESRSEENLRSALKELVEVEEEKNSQSESNLNTEALSNVLVSIEDHDSAPAMLGHEEAPDGDSGLTEYVSLTMEQAIRQLQERTGQDYSLNLPVHALPLETIVEADSEPGSMERRKKEGGAKDKEQNVGRELKRSQEEREDNISLEETLTTNAEGSELTRRSKSPQLPSKLRVLITSNRPAPSNSSAHTQKQSKK